MRSLEQALAMMRNRDAAVSLAKHLTASGITRWKDVTKSKLYDYADHAREALAPSSAHTLFTNTKTFLRRYSEFVKLPDGWEDILKIHKTKPVKTYLNEKELAALEKALTHTERQEWVKNTFLICAYTGLRLSDARNLTPDNIVEGKLRYVAQKTKKEGWVPIKKGVKERIEWLAEHRDLAVSKQHYDMTIKELCRISGINAEVVVFKAGKEQRGPKWMFISSHSARVSFASCLDRRGAPERDIMQILQHSDPATTRNYIVRDNTELAQSTLDFFK